MGAVQIVLRCTLDWSILLLGLSPSALPCLTFRVVRYLASGAGVEPLFEVDKLFSRSLLNQEWFVVFGRCIRNSHGFILIHKLLAPVRRSIAAVRSLAITCFACSELAGDDAKSNGNPLIVFRAGII
jgi:hypothetical protein